MILALQDGVVATRSMQNHIFGHDVCDSCLICRRSVESVEHLLSSCIPLAPTMYLRRHNQVLKILYVTVSAKTQIIMYADWFPPENWRAESHNNVGWCYLEASLFY